MSERASYSVTGVTGLPEVRPGDDIAALVAAAVPDLRDGDVLVVTSKLLSKAEGRLVPVPPGASEQVHRSFTATVAGFNGAPVRHVVPLPAHRVARLELQRRDHDVPGRRRAVTSERSQSTVSTF